MYHKLRFHVPEKGFFYCLVEIMVIQFDLAIAFARDGMISTYTL